MLKLGHGWVITPTTLRGYLMMTSSNGNIFSVTGPLCGEFTGHRWIPCTKASDAELWCFLWSAPKWLNKQSWGWWFETPSRSLWRLCNIYMPWSRWCFCQSLSKISLRWVRSWTFYWNCPLLNYRHLASSRGWQVGDLIILLYSICALVIPIVNSKSQRVIHTTPFLLHIRATVCCFTALETEM